MNIDKNQIRQASNSLPETIREILDSDETATAIREIGEKYHLHLDQIGNLATVTRLYIMGLITSADFDNTLIKETGISTDVANLVTYDLNQKIFLKIRVALRRTAEKKDMTTLEKEGARTDAAAEESPLTTERPAQDLFAQKMSSDFGLSREKIELKTTEASPEPTTVNVPPRKDPYREPV